jgi:intracellular multiplication protein IcmD
MRYLLLVLLSFAASAAPVHSLQDMGESVLGSFSAVANLLLNIGFVAGLGFGISAAYKFKQHKDNPAQVSVGQAIAMLFISVFLVFLPGIYRPAGKSMFGEGNSDMAGGVTGMGLINMPGGIGSLDVVTATH